MVDRVYERNTSESAPAAPADPQVGYPTAGNPSQGVPATVPGPYWFHMITESLRKVITDAGLEPDHTDLGQLLEALQAQGLGGYADAPEAQALSSLTKLLTPGRLADAFKGSNQSLIGSGYQRLPGGLIAQWGRRSFSHGGSGVLSAAITFPIAFPTAALGLATAANTNNPARLLVSASSATTTGFTMYSESTSGSGSPEHYWFAIGH